MTPSHGKNLSAADDLLHQADAELEHADQVLAHGTRACYQRQHCDCSPCKAAEAAYRTALRLRKAKGLPILGAYLSASEAWARVRVLTQEGFNRKQISGWHEDRAVRFTATSRVRLFTLKRLRDTCQRYLIDDAELPNHAP